MGTMLCLGGPRVEVHGGGVLVRPLSSTSIMLLHAVGVMGGLLPGAPPGAGVAGRGRAAVILFPSESHEKGTLACAAAFARTMSEVGDGAGGGAGSKGGVAAVPAVAGGTEGGGCRSCLSSARAEAGFAAVCEGKVGCAAVIEGGSGAAQCRPQSTAVDRGLAIAVSDALQKFV
jgi:hypothetical protein